MRLTQPKEWNDDSFTIEKFVDDAQRLTEPAKDIWGFEWSIAPLPKGNKGTQVVAVGFAIPSGTQYVAEAWHWIKWTTSPGRQCAPQRGGLPGDGPELLAGSSEPLLRVSANCHPNGKNRLGDSALPSGMIA